MSKLVLAHAKPLRYAPKMSERYFQAPNTQNRLFVRWSWGMHVDPKGRFDVCLERGKWLCKKNKIKSGFLKWSPSVQSTHPNKRWNISFSWRTIYRHVYNVMGKWCAPRHYSNLAGKRAACAWRMWWSQRDSITKALIARILCARCD